MEEGGRIKVFTFVEIEIPQHNTCGILSFHLQIFEANSKISNNDFLV